MDKRVSESLKVFDGNKFAVWKYHMEDLICFEEKDIMSVVNGTLPKPPSSDAEKTARQKANTLARCIQISSSVTMPFLENLVNCSTAACMWTTLCAFYQQKSRENIYMVRNGFFEYKMSADDSINAHVNKVMSMGNLLKDLGQPVPEDMLITKIVCSLPPSYNSILAAWTNVPTLEQTVANLKIRLLQMENLMALQGGENTGDSTFFTRSSKTPLKNKKSSHEKDKDYIKELKSRTRCYNCGSDDLPLPPSVPYREAVGCLMYAMVLARPDIAFAVSKVARFTSQPRHSHWTAVKRIFRYLSGTIDMGISYYGSPQDFTLRGYCQ